MTEAARGLSFVVVFAALVACSPSPTSTPAPVSDPSTLRCRPGEASVTMHSDPGPDAKGEGRRPVEIARDNLYLRSGEQVVLLDEREGEVGSAQVAVVRDGRVVVIINYFTPPGREGWLSNGYEACESATGLLTPRGSTLAPSPKPPRFASVQEAMRFIEERVDVEVTLPAGMEDTVTLSQDDPVYRVPSSGYYLNLDTGGPWGISIQFGGASFDGCAADVAKVTSVGDAPALYGSDRYGTTLIWPATPERTEGDFGLDTPYPLKETIRLAESMQARSGRGSKGGC